MSTSLCTHRSTNNGSETWFTKYPNCLLAQYTNVNNNKQGVSKFANSEFRACREGPSGALPEEDISTLILFNTYNILRKITKILDFFTPK
jgi:hypothetical protein